MANKRIKDLPAATETTVGDILPIDGATTRGITVENFLGGNLDAIKALTSAADKGIQFTGAGAAATFDLTPAGKALLDDGSAADQRSTLGLVIGTDVQAYDPTLQAIAGATTDADEIIYATAPDNFATTPLTASARALLDDTSFGAMRATLELGTAAQAATTDFATAAQGLLADTAVQPGDLGALALKDKASVPDDLDVTGTPDGSKFLRDDGSWQSLPGGGDMLSTNNLSDVASAATAFGNIKQAASDSVSGVVELATSAEVATGTDTARAVTPAGAAAVYSTTTRQVNAQTGTTYTLVLADAGKVVTLSNGSAITLTIPTNSSVAFPVNTQIDLAQLGAGKVTVSGAGVTINSVASNKSLAAQYAGASLLKTDTDTWLLMGALTS